MILFSYVLRDLFKYILGTLILCVFLFLLFDFLHKTTRYIPRFNPSSELLLKAYLYQVPSLIFQAIPIGSLLGSVICMLLLSRTNELTAMRAAGVGPFGLSSPIIFGGILLAFCSVFLGEVVIPRCSKQVHYIQEVLIERGSDEGINESSRWVKTKAGFFNFRDFDSVTSMVTSVRYVELSDGFKPRRSIYSRLGTFRPELKDWLLEDVQIIYFWPKSSVSFAEFKHLMPLRLPFDPTKMIRERRLPSELSTKEILESIDKGLYSGGDVLQFRLELHNKIAFYLAPLVVCLISLKFAYRSERVMETAKSVLIAVAIGMSYWFISSATRALGTRGILSPAISAWMSNIIVFSSTILVLLRQRKH